MLVVISAIHRETADADDARQGPNRDSADTRSLRYFYFSTSYGESNAPICTEAGEVRQGDFRYLTEI
jgi:hypothetical protein